MVRGHLDGRAVNAIPDTGAGYNIVSASLAEELGYTAPLRSPTKGEQLMKANGKVVTTVGVFEADWTFASEPGRNWKLVFHVLDDCVYDVVLGNAFLRSPGTMGRHKSRLSWVPRPPNALSVLFVNNLGPVGQHLRGSINGDWAEALPDSGSEPNLVSLDFVISRGLDGLVDRDDVGLLQFADGCVEKTMGSIRPTWAYRGSSTGRHPSVQVVKAKFHILRGCAYDAIVGQDVLEETDAFSRHADSFVDVEAGLGLTGLDLVIWLPVKRPKEQRPAAPGRGSESPCPAANHEQQRPWPRPTRTKKSGSLESSTLRDPCLEPDPGSSSTSPSRTPQSHASTLNAELERRAAFERRIRRMPQGPEKDAALAAEEEMRRQYDKLHRLSPLASSARKLPSGQLMDVASRPIHAS